jgi:hypothetical protein
MSTNDLDQMTMKEMIALAKTASGRSFLEERKVACEEWARLVGIILSQHSAPAAEPKAGSRSKKNEKSGAAAEPSSGSPSSGSFDDLTERYLTDLRSPYHSLRHATRTNYGYLLKPVRKHFGPYLLRDLRLRHFEEFYNEYVEEGHIAMGNGAITMARNIATFGTTVLRDEECQRLSGILKQFKFAPTVKREPMTEEHIRKICDMARKMGFASIAMAQAIQHECELKQKDVIGEWVPVSDPGVSDIIDGADKWVRGLRWDQIDKNWVLTHFTSQSQKKVVIDLKAAAPMMMAEIERVAPNKRSGPMILRDGTFKPWTTSSFRRNWRKIADEAGIPKGVRNMDTTLLNAEGDEDDELQLHAK